MNDPAGQVYRHLVTLYMYVLSTQDTQEESDVHSLQGVTQLWQTLLVSLYLKGGHSVTQVLL